MDFAQLPCTLWGRCGIPVRTAQHAFGPISKFCSFPTGRAFYGLLKNCNYLCIFGQVQLPNGQVVQVDGSGGGSSSSIEGDVIDVEVREVR